MSRIAIVTSFDTKYHELKFVQEEITRLGFNPYLVDISAGPNGSPSELIADISRKKVLEIGGYTVEYLRSLNKGDAIQLMAKCAAKVMRKLYDEGIIAGTYGMGGLQNTIVCSAAFRVLPLGFPKMICSTVASGNRSFDTIVADKDIAIMPSIVDFAGINPISEVVLTNSIVSLLGMVKFGKHQIDTKGKQYIGATLMGITNDTVMRAINTVTALGNNVISFHSTGVGGSVMESQIREGRIAAVMDLCLHEMTAEYLGDLGYSRGAKNRLTAAAEMGIPALICPGGIDFACLNPEDFRSDQEDRGYVWHTADYLTHTRLWEHEILEITNTIIERLNKSSGPTTVVLPMGGLRTMSRPGEFFHKPEIIKKMRILFEQNLDPRISFKAFDLNFDDPKFADICSDEILKLIKEKEAEK